MMYFSVKRPSGRDGLVLSVDALARIDQLVAMAIYLYIYIVYY
jgi:hypothetical protein